MNTGIQIFYENGSIQWDGSKGTSMQLGSGVYQSAGSISVSEWRDPNYIPWFSLVPTEPAGPISVSLQAFRSGTVLTWNYPNLPPGAVNKKYLSTLVVWGVTYK
ncbi:MULTISPECIES: hypothetical protein [unclassified Pseudomonas]|uniref:hypothetical protein n=1 Tax=unclassified Pseudomonas TaxID=196821 RepID=UPI001179D0F2|nr:MULTISPECIES: hypothetical protein [unclassified Pseudomonas]